MSTQLVRGKFIPLSLIREPSALPHTCLVYVKGQAFVSFGFCTEMRPLLGTSSVEQLPPGSCISYMPIWGKYLSMENSINQEF